MITLQESWYSATLLKGVDHERIGTQISSAPFTSNNDKIRRRRIDETHTRRLKCLFIMIMILFNLFRWISTGRHVSV